MYFGTERMKVEEDSCVAVKVKGYGLEPPWARHLTPTYSTSSTYTYAFIC